MNAKLDSSVSKIIFWSFRIFEHFYMFCPPLFLFFRYYFYVIFSFPFLLQVSWCPQDPYSSISFIVSWFHYFTIVLLSLYNSQSLFFYSLIKLLLECAKLKKKTKCLLFISVNICFYLLLFFMYALMRVKFLFWLTI